jgi:hypothetical protein
VAASAARQGGWSLPLEIRVWFLVHVFKFHHISAKAALLVPGKGPLPSHGGMARQRRVTHIYLDIYIHILL